MNSASKENNYRNKIRGSLLGGAVGDALGYPVEFLKYKAIQQKYGLDGIQEYVLDRETGTAVFSDDTQMTLFTANGILIGETRRRLHGGAGSDEIVSEVWRAYWEWYRTQMGDSDPTERHDCWIWEFPELHVCRDPGGTCLSALESVKMGRIDAPLNSSKGCGGVMRVAPLALFYRPESKEALRRLDIDGAKIAAITHGHTLGYLPASILTHIISLSVYGDGSISLREIVDDAWTTVKELFASASPSEDIETMERLILDAERLAATPGNDEEHIRALGEGWVGEEALAIALYCSLRYSNDFNGAMVASVNHNGDSDSTGAVTGNIVGAWLGYDAIEEKWLADLEALEMLLEVADDLASGAEHMDDNWLSKYAEGHRRQTNSR